MKPVQRIFIALAVVLAASSSAFSADWTMTDLGTLPSPVDYQSYGVGINNLGQVVGGSRSQPAPIEAIQERPVLFDGGAVVDLGSLGGSKAGHLQETEPGAIDINNNGVIVGNSITSEGYGHAFSYANGVMTDLGTLGGLRSHASAINDSGVIVGGADTPASGQHAFVYSNGTMTDIGGGNAMGINESGQVVGIAASFTGFLYSDGVMQTLPDGIPYAINDHGLIVGNTAGPTFEDVKAAYYENGGWHSIGTLGGIGSGATSVNNRDQIVGYYSGDAGRATGGFFYSNGLMQDISSFVDPAAGWSLLQGIAINDQGQIAGYGRVDGTSHAFLLTPTMSTFELDATYTESGAHRSDRRRAAGRRVGQVADGRDRRQPGDVSGRGRRFGHGETGRRRLDHRGRQQLEPGAGARRRRATSSR